MRYRTMYAALPEGPEADLAWKHYGETVKVVAPHEDGLVGGATDEATSPDGAMLYALLQLDDTTGPQLAGWISDGLREERRQEDTDTVSGGLSPSDWAVIPAIEHLLDADDRETVERLRRQYEGG